MRSRDLFVTAVRSLRANRTRSALTILGIVIGITAIILVVSLGESAERVITNELGGLGADTIVVRAGKEPKGPSDFAEALLGDSIREREFQALLKKSNVPDLVAATPEVFVTGSVSYAGETYKPVILGVDAQFFADTLGLELAYGRMYDQQDVKGRARVAVIGDEVASELFGTSDPLGKQIDIKGTKFRVVGVLEDKGQVVFFNVDDAVLVPYTTAAEVLTGQNHYTQLIVRASSAEIVDEVIADIKVTLRELHRIKNPEDDDFHVESQQGLVEQVQTIIGAFTLFLSFVIAIALVVGGVGIMNIMLVSVGERTPEIGLRKAVGATDEDIMRQFLLEAVLLTVIGGIIGALLGAALSFGGSVVLAKVAGLAGSYRFPYGAAFVGIIVSGLVGVVFGLYPARQAAKKNPIEALRYE